MSKVSIIMPAKNAEKWIGATIDSILNQSHSNWELICIDDHSTDNTFEILEQLSNNNPKIKIYKNQGTGIIPALQLGIKNADGRFICRMDADDIMPKYRLKQMADKLNVSTGKTIITGKVEYFSNGDVSEGYLNYQSWLNERVDKADHWKHIYRECIIASPNWMAKKADLINDEIFDQLEYPEDYSMCFLWKQSDYEVHSVPNTTLLWREHPERTSRNSSTYDQESFFNLKLNWFNINHKEGSIAILGAGQKGKLVINKLKEFTREIKWYDLKHEQYNSPIEGLYINNYNELNEDFLLIAIYPKQQSELLKFLQMKGYEIGLNAWFL